MNGRDKKASSQVAWSLLTEGVTQARVDTHRLRLMVDRALAIVDQSEAKDHIYQVAGDLIEAVPSRLSDIERSLDRTSYALVVMGDDFLRGRIPFDDRHEVDEAVKSAPFSTQRAKESRPNAARVASRALAVRVALRYAANTSEHHFFDNPEKREVLEFADSGALSNLPSVAIKSVKDSDGPDRTVAEARAEAKSAPPDPEKIEKKPGGKQFSTLNRYVVETEQPRAGRVPQGRSELPKAKPQAR